MRIRNVIYTVLFKMFLSYFCIHIYLFSFCIQKLHHWIQSFPFLLFHTCDHVLPWTNRCGFCHLPVIWSQRLFPIVQSSHTRDMLRPIEADFINLPPTLPRKSNFLQLSKGYSWNIYRVEIKLESWNCSNVYVLRLYFLQACKTYTSACVPIFDRLCDIYHIFKWGLFFEYILSVSHFHQHHMPDFTPLAYCNSSLILKPCVNLKINLQGLAFQSKRLFSTT